MTNERWVWAFQMFCEGTFIIFGVTYLFFCIQIFCENPDGDIRGVIAMFWSVGGCIVNLSDY